MSMMQKTPPEPAMAIPTFWRSAPLQGRLDCETAALLRACVRHDFEAADSWAELIRALGRRGLRLAFRRGRLVLLHGGTGTELCTDGFLGQRLPDLVCRLGRPAVRVTHPATACGELRH